MKRVKREKVWPKEMTIRDKYGRAMGITEQSEAGDALAVIEGLPNDEEVGRIWDPLEADFTAYTPIGLRTDDLKALAARIRDLETTLRGTTHFCAGCEGHAARAAGSRTTTEDCSK